MSPRPSAHRSWQHPEGGPRLSAHVGGDGPPVLFLHGFTGSGAAWGDLPQRLMRRHRVVVVELPGHGASDAPHEPDAYASSAVVRLLADLMDELAPGRATWIGYSMGARLALAGALSGRVDLAALVLESGSPGLDDANERAARVTSDEAWARRLENEGIQAFVDGWMAQSLFASQATLPREVQASERRRRLTGDPKAWAACLRGLGTGREPSRWAELGDVGCPTLLLTGSLDARFDAIAERMAGAMPAAARAVIPGAGHAVHLEKPEAWLSAVDGFLRGVFERNADA